MRPASGSCFRNPSAVARTVAKLAGAVLAVLCAWVVIYLIATLALAEFFPVPQVR